MTGVERKTAEERREAVLGAAMAEFATRGLHGASTERVARDAGIAHFYVFKLFGTKKDLFLAATEKVYDQVLGLFCEGAGSHPENPLRGMWAAKEQIRLPTPERKSRSDPSPGFGITPSNSGVASRCLRMRPRGS